jgi:hypothetical protein
MSTGTIQIPVLFDMSGDTIVFGEEVSGDFVSSHLNFILDMTTEANDISLNAADISGTILIGDQNTGDNLFYSGGTNGNIAVDQLCNRIAKAITRGKLVHIPKTGNHSNSGIPMGGRATLVNALGELGSLYATKYLTSIAPIGDEQMLGNAMARVASIHLVGSPLSSGIFQDATQIQTDLETASSQTFNSGGTAFYNALAVQLSKVLGGSKSSAPMNSGAGSGDYNYLDVSTTGNSNNSGTIVATASGTAYSMPPSNLIDGTISYSTSWIGSESVLYGSDKSYTGSQSTTYNTNQTVAGEWAQIDLGTALTASDKIGAYGLWGNETSDRGRSIHAGKLLGSNNGSAWNLVHEFTGNEINDYFTSDGPTNNYAQGYLKEIRVDFPTQNNYRYFRIVIISQNSMGNEGKPSFGGIALYKKVSEGYPLDASGVSCPALKSIYEQLMNVPGRSQIMQTRDISGTVDNSNITLGGGFPFITGDKLVMYLRPKIVFAAQTFAEQTTSLQGFMSATTLDEPVFNVGRSGQGITGQSYGQSDYYDNNNSYKGLNAFDGVVTGTYGWLANNPFNATTGAYAGAVATSVDGANVLGSWVQVNVGKKVAVNNYKIYPQNWETASIGGRSPHIFKLIYSNDGTNFTTADSRNVGSNNVDVSDWVNESDVYTPKTFTLSENQVGQYWRLLVTSVYGNNLSNGGALAIQELELKGVENFTEKGDISGGAISDISGLVTNVTATAANIETAFPGNATTGDEPETNKWGWIGSANSTMLTLETTDSNDIRTIDLHVWKITITL